MSRCLRYRNVRICDHLASQYVAGVMTERVKRRMDKLLATTPELDRAVASWSDHFSELHDHLPDVTLNARAEKHVWDVIEHRIALPEPASVPAHATTYWENLFIWRLLSGAGILALAIALVFPTFTSIPQVPALNGPHYLANMTAHGDSLDNVQFVISAYKKSQNMPASRLNVQWSRGHKGNPEQQLHLWAEDRNTGEITYIGYEPEKGQNWNLTKFGWKAIANSRRLFMTETQEAPKDSNIVFSGFCIQLKPWTQVIDA